MTEREFKNDIKDLENRLNEIMDKLRKLSEKYPDHELDFEEIRDILSEAIEAVHNIEREEMIF